MAKKTASVKTVGQNIEVTTDGDKLILTIDLSAKTEPSKSGKTQIIATSRGNARVTDEWFMGLNVYRYAKPRKEK